MPTLEELTIIINANTNALFKATSSIDKFEKSSVKSTDKINKAFSNNTKVIEKVVKDIKKKVKIEGRAKKSITDVEKAQIRQSKSLVSAREKFLNLSSAIKRSGMEQDQMNNLLQKSKSTIGAYTTSMNAAVLSTQKFTEANNKFTRRMGVAKRELTEFNSEVRKIKTKKAAEDTEKFKKAMTELSKSVQIALGPLSGVASRITAFSALVTSGAAPLALFAGGVIAFGVAFIKSAKSAATFQLELLRIEAILDATASKGKISVAQVAAMANELGELTLTTESAARQAAAVLLSFPTIPRDKLKEILELSQDLATVMKTELASAAAQLGRALEDPISGMTALRRAGVIFSPVEQQLIKDLVEMNRVADAQSIILNNLAGTLGGAAKREAEGLAGAWDTLGERLKDFQVIAGTVLLGPLTDLIKGMSKKLKELSDETDIASQVGAIFAKSVLLMQDALILLRAALRGIDFVITSSGIKKFIGVVVDITKEIIPLLQTEKELRQSIASIEAKRLQASQRSRDFHSSFVDSVKEELNQRSKIQGISVKARALAFIASREQSRFLKLSTEESRIATVWAAKKVELEILLGKKIKENAELKKRVSKIEKLVSGALKAKSPDELSAARAEQAAARKIATDKVTELAKDVHIKKLIRGASEFFTQSAIDQIGSDEKLRKLREIDQKERDAAFDRETARLKQGFTEREGIRKAALRRVTKLGKEQIKEEAKIFDKETVKLRRMFTEQERIRKAALKRVIELEKEQAKEIKKLIKEEDKIFDEETARLKQMFAEQERVRKAALKAVIRLEKEAIKLEKEANKARTMFAESFTQGLAGGFADIIVNGERGKDVIHRLIKAMAQLILQTQLYNALARAFGLSAAPASTYQSSNFADPGQGTAGLAHGGPVSRNKSYIVGERGPELFIPSGSGKIVSNNKLGKGGSNSNNRINVNIYNQNNSDVTIKETPTGNGGMDIEVMISNIIAGNIRNNGITAQAINESFGARPRTTQR